MSRVARLFSMGATHSIVVVDPCAGEGAAIAELHDCFGRRSRLYAVEMEEERYRALCRLRDRGLTALHADAFQVEVEPACNSGAGLLWLNPPYDHHPECGRMEEAFLARWHDCLREGGALCFVVPFYALGASARTLATHFEQVTCHRFPGESFDAFKQVFLVAKKAGARVEPDPAILALVNGWSDDAESIPELAAEPAPLYPLPGDQWGSPFAHFRVIGFDLLGLQAAARPWHQSSKGGITLSPVPGIPVAADLAGLLHKTYPVAMPPKPVHLAAAIASGIFNGARLDPDDTAGPLPPLLVKGSFDREWRKLENKVDKQGNIKGEIHIQQPRLVVTVLDLRARTLHELTQGTTPTGSTSPASMNIADLLASYGASMMRELERQCPALHDPRREGDRFPLRHPVARPLYRAQEEVVRAAVRLLGGPGVPLSRRKGKAALVLGQIGSGKTGVTLATIAECEARRVLVVCPPHLLDSWAEQTRAVLPDARCLVLSTVEDVEALAADTAPGLLIGLLSRETAKLGHSWEGAPGLCPACGGPTPRDKDGAPLDGPSLARLRTRCALVSPPRPSSRGARLTAAAALAVWPCWPDSVEAVESAHGIAGRPLAWARYALARRDDEGKKARSDAAWARFVEGPLPGRLARYLLAQLGDPRTVKDRAEKLVGAILALGQAIAGERPEIVADLALRLGVCAYAECLADSYTRPDAHAALAVSLLLAPLPASLRGEVQATLDACQGSIPGRSHAPYAVDRMEPKGDGTPDPKRLLAALGLLRGLTTWTKGEECGEPLYQAIPDPRRTPLARYIVRRHPGLFDLLVVDECFPAGTPISVRGGTVPIERVAVGDMVLSWNEATGRMEERRVVRLYRKAPASLVRVTAGGKSVVCTANHPFLTTTGWKPAALLTDMDIVLTDIHHGTKEHVDGAVPSLRDDGFSHGQHGAAQQREGLRLLPDGLLSPVHGGSGAEAAEEPATALRLGVDLRRVPGARVADRLQGQPGSKGGLRLLLERVRVGCDGPQGGCQEQGPYGQTSEGLAQRADANQESDEQPRGEGAGHGKCQARGLHAEGAPRGQWPSDAGTAALAVGGAGLADRGGGEHAPGAACDGGDSDAHLLQDRHRERGVPGGRRGGWRVSSEPRAASAGPQEDDVLGGARVDRVEVLQPGGDGEYGGLCPGGLVYNFEVEGTHTYVAGGLIVHNCHEGNSPEAAQTKAFQRLYSLGLPTLALTGSVMNGYAESLFSNLWALSPAFREEFKRDERKTYTDRYGYRKKLVEDRDAKTKEVVAFGSHSDRTERTERILGDAPGVLPVVVLRHLLPIAVTLHKDDLALDLPRCHESREGIEPAGELRQHYNHLQSKLIERIKQDQFGPLAGKLFGAMLELPAYLDRASEDVGNGQPGVYQIRYPESAGGAVVAEVPLLPAGAVLPKEQWLLDTVARELAEGRRCMVFVWNVNLLPRLARLLEQRLGEKVATLVPERVPTQKRQTWIDREVVAKKVRVMLVNSVTVQTGLNNLVWFATEVWYQNPACNPVVYRQAVGRVDRIGQTRETRILFPIYLGTAQEQAHKLLMTKVGLSMALDGLDGEAALMAAGGGEWSAMAGLSVAKQLYELVEKMAPPKPAPKAPAPRAAPRPARALPPVGITLGMDFGE